MKTATNDFKFTQDFSMYTPKDQSVYPINIVNWRKLKQMIKNIIPHSRIFQILASIMLGTFFSSILSLVALNTSEKPVSWAISTTWIILICSLIIGLALFYLDKLQKEFITASTTSVLEEMELIEENLEPPIVPNTEKI